MVIVIDEREKGSIVPAQLEKMKVPVEYRILNIGDYLISNQLCVERKSVGDYVGSLISGRLNNQLNRMSYHYPWSLLIVEGFIDEVLWFRKLNRRVYLSSLAGSIVKRAPDGAQGFISLVSVSTPYDTALLLYYLHKKIEKNEVRLPRVNVPKKRVSLEIRKLNVLCSLPGLGELKAQRLLERFGSIDRVVNASISELASVKGISEKMAREIWRVLHE